MNTPQRPVVSVIIPAYYSAGTISGCLDALRLQTYRSFEVIVINSSPEPETEYLVRRRYPEVLFKQHPARLLPHAARNQGVALARGDLLVFTDPDCDADPCWLERLVLASGQDCQALVGAMDLSGNRLWEQAIHLIKFHWLLPGLTAATRFCAPTANAAYSRQLWNRIGPFPGDFYAADGIMSYRAALAGHPPRFVSSAVVRHHHLNPIMDLVLQRFSRGRDYARAQLCRMGKPDLFCWLRLIFSWLALPLVLVRALCDASQGHWLRPYLLTFPIQALGHGSWAFGESWGALELLFRNDEPGVK
jgi:O-antigen biosynthesis protein